MITFSVLISLLLLNAEIPTPKSTPEIAGKGTIPTESRNNEPQKGTEYSEPKAPPKPSPPPHLQPSTDTVDSQPNASKEENTLEKSLGQRIFGWIVARTAQDLFTFVIALATVFLAIFTGQLVRATSIAEPIGINHSKMDIEVSFQLVNEGKGIAVIDGVRFQAQITPGIFDVIVSKRAFGRNVLPKSTQLPIRQQVIRSGNTSPYSARFSLPVQDWERVISKENQIFIVGLVSYQDVFRRPFSETFRFGYEPPFKGVPGSPIADFSGALYLSRKSKKHNKKKQVKSNPGPN